MSVKNFKKCLFVLVMIFSASRGFGQGSVPVGINYQAVARDNSGKELASKNIDVKFSILSGNPLGTLVYQELHSNVTTSKFGVFSLIIGKGASTGGTVSDLSLVSWSQAAHYLKVEVKFDNTFIEMGTMQFLAVPYALYAQKSLEPGPQGLKGDTGPQGLQGVQGQKGDRGDPASDNQTLSFDGTNLSVSVGDAGALSTVNLSSLNIPHNMTIAGDRLSISGGNEVTLPNQIQDLSLDINNILSISKSTAPAIDLTRFLDDKQQLSFNNTSNTLIITNGTTPIDLSKFNQTLTFTPADYKLSISGGTSVVDLSPIKNDALQDLTLTGTDLSLTKSAVKIDMTPYVNTDNQALTYNSATNTLSLTNGGSANLERTIIAFRARKTTPETGLTPLSDYDFITPIVDYNNGGGFDGTTGIFTAPVAGIYTFVIGFTASGSGGSRELKLFLDPSVYEIINTDISSGSSLARSITLKLIAGDKVKVLYYSGISTESGTGSFSGYRVY